MKKVAQVFGYTFTDTGIVDGWKKYLDQLIILEPNAEPIPEIPLILNAMPLGTTANRMKNKNPFFAMNRAYLGAWKFNNTSYSRISVNSFACTKLNNIPYSRWEKLGIEKRDWAVSEVKNILIAPGRKSHIAFSGEQPLEWAEKLKAKFESEGANVRIRLKQGKRKAQLLGDPNINLPALLGPDGEFEWADLVISYSSAITTEALWYGKKAISLGVCPTWVACDNHLNNWKDPTEPINRDVWHEHMAWIQFSADEWHSGEAQEATVFYQGWPTEVPDTNNEILSK